MWGKAVLAQTHEQVQKERWSVQEKSKKERKKRLPRVCRMLAEGALSLAIWTREGSKRALIESNRALIDALLRIQQALKVSGR